MNEKSRLAFQLLRVGFTIAPILAGLDKFTNVMTDWTAYLAPFVPQMLGMEAATIMMIVGVVEIIAGVLVAVKPKFGGAVVAVWLVGIIGNLLIVGGYLDIALRDLGLAIGAAALSLLATDAEATPTPVS